MYLDNLFSAAATANGPQISYSELLEDTLRMAEVEAQGELLLMKTEAAKHILGSEGPSEWWTKIKVVARKLFEMLKNLINKVFTFVKSIPQKVANTFRRIQLKWSKVGMEDKWKAIQKKSGIGIREQALKDLQDRTWNLPWLIGVAEGNGSVVNAASFKSAIDSMVKTIKDIKVGKLASMDAADQASEKAKIKNAIDNAVAVVKDKIGDADNNEVQPYKGASDVAKVTSVIAEAYNVLRNNEAEKEAKTISAQCDRAVREIAQNARIANGEIEKAQRNDDEDAARASIDALKLYRTATAAVASLSSKAVNAVLRAGIANASIAQAGMAVMQGGKTGNNNMVR